jgi:pimeloyl-ACP methyl ester carboxylesterase
VKSAAVVALLVAGALAATGAPASASGADYQPTFESAPCPPEVAGDPTITCGFLTVPEDRADPAGAVVRLFVTRLAGRTGATAADPVVVLQGGPGDTPDLGSFVDHPLRDARDVIVLDQRGTGRSEPSLACPEIAEDERARLALDLDDDTAVEAAATAARKCRDRLEGAGVDLTAYDSAASATDVADLRLALDIDEWNLAGHSYGSRLALTVVRDHPEGVRSVALSGPEPPRADEPADLAANAEAAFEVLFDACADDTACHENSPDLRATFEQLVEQLEAAPVVVEATDSAGRVGTVRFDGDLLPLLLFNALYESDLIPALPGLLEELARGEGFALVAGLVLDRSSSTEVFSHGMNLSVQCQDEVALSGADPVTPEERAVDYLRAFARTREIERAQCEQWDTGRSPRREARIVRSRVPTLILVGEYDPITPPAYGRLTAETLPGSHVFELAGLGHDATTRDCPRLLRNRFFADPTARPDDPCLDDLGPPPFARS